MTKIPIKQEKKQSIWLKIGITIAVLVAALGLVFGVFCLMALLLTLVWNGVVVGILTVATPLAFWKAVVLWAGFWFLMLIVSISRAYGNANIQRWQMQQSMGNMKKFMESMGAQEINPYGGEDEPPDLMRHFGNIH